MTVVEALFHVAPASRWSQLGPAEAYTDPSLDTEGFIHCSTADQLLSTLADHFGGIDRADLVVLEIDPGRLTWPLRWEAASPGGSACGSEVFPHVYGPIDRAAIVTSRPARE